MCRATQNQTKVSDDQVKIIQDFLSIGNQDEALRELVLRKTAQDQSMWNQTLIFLALVSFRPLQSKIVPPLRIDEVWHYFILCTKQYHHLCCEAAGRYLDHVPDALCVGPKRKNWFRNWARLTSFLDGRIPEYNESVWHDPEDFRIMTRDLFEHYKKGYINSHYYSYTDSYREGCNSCGERCAD